MASFHTRSMPDLLNTLKSRNNNMNNKNTRDNRKISNGQTSVSQIYNDRTSSNSSFLELYDNDDDDFNYEEGSDKNNNSLNSFTESYEIIENDRLSKEDNDEDDNKNSTTTTTTTTTTTNNNNKSNNNNINIPFSTASSAAYMNPADSLNSFDRYGFKKENSYVTESQYDTWWKEYSVYSLRRKKKWEILLNKSGISINNNIPKRYPPKSEKLKRYIRKGIPAEWRGEAWWYFARGDEKLNKNKGLYDNLLQKINSKDVIIGDAEIIERDLNRTFPDNMHFMKDTENEPSMVSSLRRVLYVFALYQPEIGYCQSMNFLAGLLLLFLDEERSFWMLVIITSRILPNVHSVNLEGVNVDQGVLMLCVEEYLPEFWFKINPQAAALSSRSKHLSLNHHHINMSNTPFSNDSSLSKNDFLFKLPPITLCTASWFMSCFIGIVPIETTLRIWDCLFYEGSHVLFKISLAIIKLSESALQQSNSSNNGSSGSYSSSNSSGNNGTGAFTHHNNNTNLLNRHSLIRRKSKLSLHDSHSNTVSNNSDDIDMEIFQTMQTFPKTLLNPNDIFEKIIFKKKYDFNSLNQEEIDRCRKYVVLQRTKYKNYVELLSKKKDRINNNNEGFSDVKEEEDSNLFGDITTPGGITKEDIERALTSEVYGFKRNLTSVHWNNSIKQKVRQMRKRDR
ncbi:related to GTPase-activating protein GYP3 [Saccharomycodes ludwigii]|uniref:Related to GTPase-activating protein GYP3 n=1 Tax=Saccharomycodes ludwigii TaxID=36035 RepID=A0A376B5F6_9ASCO|nr:related to GTPase-activating protein GYP3 [Saccharomycodes ludwigii]